MQGAGCVDEVDRDHADRSGGPGRGPCRGRRSTRRRRCSAHRVRPASGRPGPRRAGGVRSRSRVPPHTVACLVAGSISTTPARRSSEIVMPSGRQPVVERVAGTDHTHGRCGPHEFLEFGRRSSAGGSCSMSAITGPVPVLVPVHPTLQGEMPPPAEHVARRRVDDRLPRRHDEGRILDPRDGSRPRIAPSFSANHPTSPLSYACCWSSTDFHR